MRINPQVGEVWYADLGIAAKSRPVLVLVVPGEGAARDLVIVAPLTSQIRSMEGEVPLGPVRWLPKPSAVNVQGLASFHRGKLARRMGRLTDVQLGSVKEALRNMFKL